MTAAFALQADVRAEAHYRPLVRTAGMRLAQTEQVVKLEIREHDLLFSFRVLALMGLIRRLVYS